MPFEIDVISSKFLGAAEIHPVPQLLHAHFALRRCDADLTEPVGKLVARQADERGPRRRHIGFERSLLHQCCVVRLGRRLHQMGLIAWSFRDGPKDQTRNLEIPGSMLRIAPE
ncbi:hypothetical protein ABIE89_001688 [Bradyrhizobium niftali]